jgi:hypothetical protein
MNTAEWLQPLLHGCGALGLAALGFGLARLRFTRRRERGDPTDVGLD